MLSVSMVRNAAKAANYYTSEDNYYFLGEWATGWYGAGAESLGLEGPVKRDVFQAVLEGRLPDGSDLTHMVGNINKHRPGYDLTFSAPKSVSVLALVAGDTFLIEAHDHAVERTLNEVEKIASTRTMKNGQVEFEQTGNLVVAKFLHDISRNLDPQLHTHAVVANVTLTGEGWKTLSTDMKTGRGFTDTVWNQQVSIGAVYRRFLRDDLEKAGYPIVDSGPRGEWDIAGVPVQPFSSRREEILAAVGENASARAKSVAALDSRKPKDFAGMAAVHEGWQQKLNETGFDYEAFQASRQTQQAQQITPDAPEPPPVNKEMAAIVDDAIALVSRKSVRFTFDAVLTTVLNQVPVREGILQEARTALEAAVEKGSLIAVDKTQTLFTSAGHLRDEQRLSQIAGHLAERQGNITVPADDRGIAARVADSNRGISLIDARGGSDFQGQLIAKISSLAGASKKTPVMVVSSQADKQRWLDAGQPKVLTADELRGSALPAGSMVIVSEAERFSVPTLYATLQVADRAEAPTVIIDTHARRTTGFASEVLKQAGVPVFTATAALERSRLTLVQKDTVDDRMTVAARYVSSQLSAGLQVVAQAGNARSRDQLTRNIRAALREDGQLGDDIITVNAFTPVWLDADSRRLRSTYQAGMVLERVSGQTVASRLTIAGVSEQSHSLTVIDEKGTRQGLKINDIGSDYRLWKVKPLALGEGEQVRTTGSLNGKGRSGETLKVAGVKSGNWLFKEKLLLQKADGQIVKVRTDRPIKLDYGYTEGLGASRNTQGNVVAVLSGREVNDSTINLLRRSGENVIAFTALDEAAITARLEKERASVSVTQGVRALGGNDSLTTALRNLQNSRLAPRERAVRTAIEKVTGTGVTFSRFDVIDEAMAIDKTLTPNVAVAELDRQERRGEIIALEGTQGSIDAYVSRENWQNELTILRHIAEGKGSLPPLLSEEGKVSPLSPNEVPGSRHMEGLTQGQRQAAELILRSSDRFITIQGYAGTGKTTQYRAVVSAVAEIDNPPRLIGLAPTHRAVSELQGAGIPAQTLASFLSEYSDHQVRGETPDFSNTLFVVDESSMVGNRHLADLTEIIAAGNGRAVMSGDEAQLKPLESGVPFSLTLHRSAADSAVMREIVRQTPALRPAIEAIIAGNVRDAVDVVSTVEPRVVPREEQAFVPKGSVVNQAELIKAEKALAELENRRPRGISLIEMIADDYIGRTATARDETLIIAELNADRREINAAVHERLQEQGDLGDSVTVPHLVRVGNSMADLGRPAFWKSNAGNTVRIGERYFAIGNTDPKSNVVELTAVEGGAKSWISPQTLRTQNVAVFEMENIEVSVGERMRLTATDRDRLLRTNDIAVVTGVTPEGKITLDTDGRAVTLDPKTAYADRHVDYGYAVTTYSAQGSSVPYIIALEGIEGGRKLMAAQDSAYVALSRSKEHVQLYVDDLTKWQSEVSGNSGRRNTVHDVLLRAEDVKAQHEVALWEHSKAVSQTRLAGKVDEEWVDASRFQAGKKPELLFAAVNEHGRHRGNWHVPVSPTTGRLDLAHAHYEGANDGTRIVLQQGDTEGRVIETDSVQEALSVMADEPQSAVVMTRGKDARATIDTETREDITELSLDEALARQREAEEEKIIEELHQPTEVGEKAKAEDAPQSEEEKQLDAELAEYQRQMQWYEASLQAKSDADKPKAREMMNDEVNVIRHKETEPDPELVKDVQKTMD